MCLFFKSSIFSRYRQYSLPNETLSNQKLQRNADCDMNCGGMMSPTKNPPDEQRIKSEYLIQSENNQEVVLSKNEGTEFHFLLQNKLCLPYCYHSMHL